MKAERLLNAVELLIKEVDDTKFESPFPNQIRDELEDIIAEFLEEIYFLAAIPSLEKRVTEAQRIDIEAIREVLNLIERENPQNFRLDFGDNNTRDINTENEIYEIRKELNDISEKILTLGRMEVFHRLELILDSKINELLMAFDQESALFDQLAEKLIEKLNSVGQDEMLLLWASLKGEFKEQRGLIKYPELFPDNFWSGDLTLDQIRENYAIFIAKIKPLTIKKMIADGIFAFSIGLPGVARILAINENGKFVKITGLEISIVRLASKIVVVFEQLTIREKDTLARAMGLETGGLIFGGYYYEEYKRNVVGRSVGNRNIDFLKVLSTLMKRILRYSEEIHVSQSDIAQALWQHKLGQEVIAPKRTGSIKSGKESELSLQKELSKFLIEKNILSFGRTFGRSEIDLFTNSFGGEDFVIEVKVYKKSPKEKAIKNHLVQLKSYMDQISQPRGVLLIYNCSDDVIIAPRHWFGGRLWILAINIGKVPPSGRKRSLEIKPSANLEEPLYFEEYDSSPKKPAKKKTKKRQLRKRQ